MMNYETLLCEVQDSVGVITLNRPQSLNALTPAMARDFQAAVQMAVADKARTVIVTGSGRAFCAGGDLREMQMLAAGEGRVEAFFDEPLRQINKCILLIRQTPLPFIAAVHGAASGGGCNLALACDFVLAKKNARFNQAFIRVGLTPDCGGTFILPRLIGWRKANELLMTGEIVDARQALALGMVNAVVADGELMTRAMELAGKLVQAPTAAIGRIKRLLEASATSDFAAQLDLEREVQLESGQTQDAREGISAFVEKRPPNFVGK